MKKTFLFLSLAIVLFASCTANRGFVSTVTRDDIRQMKQFEPLANVGIIEKGNKVKVTLRFRGRSHFLIITIKNI